MVPRPAAAQTVDAFFGLNALSVRQAVQNIPRLGGGLFPSLGANLMLGHIGVGGEVAFRAGSKDISGASVRPIYYDFNLVFAPFEVSRSIAPELLVGLGGQDARVYTGVTQCTSLSGCSNYVSANHLAAHLGLLLKIYLTGHIFLQPEAHFYFVRHDLQFHTSNAQRYGISIGYTLGGS